MRLRRVYLVLPALVAALQPVQVSGSSAAPAPAVTWTATITGTGSGTVSASSGGINCSGRNVSCAGLFAEGSIVIFTATAAAGHSFAGWQGACTGTTPTCQVFVSGSQTVVATFNAPTALQYYHVDVLGSVRAITDANGGERARIDYLPFGESPSPMTGDPRKFTGKERDPETAMDYFDARYFRNVWGRFTTVDPGQASGSTHDPQGWNAYAYARNNPLKYTDPSGLLYAVWQEGGTGFTTVSDANWEEALAGPGCACQVVMRGAYGYVFEWAAGAWKHALTFQHLFDDPKPKSPLSQFAGSIAETAGPGVNAAMVVGAPNMILATWASVGAPIAMSVGRQALAAQATRQPLSGKIAADMAKRGWTLEAIRQTIARGREMAEMVYANGNPAARFIDPTTGLSVVVDLTTRTIIQVGRADFMFHRYR